MSTSIQNTDFFKPNQNLENFLLQDFLKKGPYYTSYPSLRYWDRPVDSDTYRNYLKDFFKNSPNAPMHLYLHVPFCAKLCWYCACNIIVTKDREKIQGYLNYLMSEIELYKKFFAENNIKPNFKEIHFGGGTPSHLNHAEFKQLMASLRTLVNFDSLDELTMEIDPRTCNDQDILFYVSEGVSRISFGVQDFDPDVQKAVNRVQPPEMIAALLTPEVRKSLKGVNFDLLYGLPMQTPETFRKTVELTKEFKPERITLLKYAHTPDIRSHMNLIKESDLLDNKHLPYVFYDTVTRLCEFGYEWVGIDNFALKTDDLGAASVDKKVFRTFNGFTPGRTRDMISLGPGSTSKIGPYYAQNVYENKEYFKLIDEGKFTTFSGFDLNRDQEIRRDIIFSIICNLEVDFGAINSQYQIDVDTFFAREIDILKKDFLAKNYIELDSNRLKVTKDGRFFVRLIALTFDEFLINQEYKIHGC